MGCLLVCFVFLCCFFFSCFSYIASNLFRFCISSWSSLRRLEMYPFLLDCPTCWPMIVYSILLFKILYLFLEGKGRRKRKRKMNVWLPHMPPIGNLAHNPGMCPDWKLNRWPLDLQAGAQSTEPHQAGLFVTWGGGKVFVVFVVFFNDSLFLEWQFFHFLFYLFRYSFFSWWVWLKFCQFYLSFKELVLSFIDLFYGFSKFLFHLFPLWP